jgi:hypothetical protein
VVVVGRLAEFNGRFQLIVFQIAFDQHGLSQSRWLHPFHVSNVYKMRRCPQEQQAVAMKPATENLATQGKTRSNHTLVLWKL